MTYQPLHHKYRPQTFANLVGQEAIATTLAQAIQQQRIAPAYLFTGARGTGKTSSARILAKSLNCLKSDVPTEKPCGQCEVCRAIANGNALDVIEIDAASNTGVDNIRELIERSQFAPVQCRYKVYVIDECHMLSAAAFNALLKTLEEPPDRVVFVLATTDPQRVLPTIISRCQKFDFRRIPLDAMVNHLRQIADKETIAITDDAITLVAQISQGGLRDAESLLDQLSLLAEGVTVEKVWDLVGSVPERDLMALLEAIAQDDPETLLNSTRRLMDRGREPMIVLQNLASFYRDLLIAKTAPNRGDLVALTASTWSNLCEFAQMLEVSTILAGQQHLRSSETQLKHTTQPRLWLEITLMGLLPSAVGVQPSSLPASSTMPRKAPSVEPGLSAGKGGNRQEEAIAPPPPAPEPATPTSAAAPSSPSSSEPSKPDPIPAEPVSAPVEESSVSSQPSDPNLNQIWQQIIAHLHPLSKALLNEHGRLLGFDGQEARIGISSSNLVKIAQNQVKNIEKAFSDVFSQKVKVGLEVAPSIAGGATSTQMAVPETGNPSTGVQPGTANSKPTPTNKPNAAPAQSSKDSNPTPNPPTVKSGSAADAEIPKPPDSPQPNAWEEEDEAIRAAKQLAEFFGGKVVSDREEPSELGEIASDSSDTPKPDPKWSTPTDGEPDDDVPF